MPHIKHLASYIPTVLILIGITYVSLWREPSFSLPRFVGADKVAHFIMYAVLSVVFFCDSWRAQRNHSTKPRYMLHAICYMSFALYGGLIELLQEQFFYPRTGTWGDWLADIAGCVVGFMLFLVLWKQARTN